MPSRGPARVLKRRSLNATPLLPTNIKCLRPITPQLIARSPDLPEEIYHLNEQGSLESVKGKTFEQESDLQSLIARYPELLSGNQINPESPRRWILIGREQGIADLVGGGHRWALDHLLIDQDAIPTLVEVKRSENSEIRRSVVGQMMDYAAHATKTWDVHEIRRIFEQRPRTDGKTPDEEIAALLQSENELDVDNFWEVVKKNLRTAHLRLLFVADSIPRELARVVEFLNEQMPDTEVLAVEIKQFPGRLGRTLVPRIIGRPASVSARSSGSHPKRSVEEILSQMPSPGVRRAAERLIDIAYRHGGIVYPGSVAFSIRYTSPVWRNPISLAWINPIPDYSGWQGTKEFTFGMENYALEDKPSELVTVLKKWAAEFKKHNFATKYPYEGLDAWIVKHQVATDNIDFIASRLEKVLDDLKGLSPRHDVAC